MNHLLRAMTILCGCLAIMAGAEATTYRWTWNSTGHVDGPQSGGGELYYNPAGGNIRSIDTSYDSGSKRLTYEATYNNTDTNGMWLVLSPGANPKGHAGELAIFYLDASGSIPTLLAYSYNGFNGHNSWRDGSPASGTQTPDLILSSLKTTSWINNLTVSTVQGGGRRFAFDIDASAVQNHIPVYPGPGGQTEWTGAGFGNEIGIWNHSVKGLQSSYSRGALSNWSYSTEGWVDGGHLETVPEPATLASLGLGIAGIIRKRRKR